MENYHQRSQNFMFDVQPLDTQVLPDHHHLPGQIPLDICFKLSVYFNYLHVHPDDDNALIHHDAGAQDPKIATATIVDVRWLETQNQDVRLCLSHMLSAFEIDEENWGGVASKVIECGRRIRDSDSNKGPKKLRLKVDMEIHKNFVLSEEPAEERVLERDALIKKMLKRVRVVADDNYDVEKDSCGDEEEEEGGKRKRRRVVQESEVCPICMEGFLAGSEDVTGMPCSHVFHGKCIGRWLQLRKSQSNCPVCRFQLPVN